MQKYVKSCRSRQELSNEYLVAKIGVDTAENEPLKVWRKIQFNFHSPPYQDPSALEFAAASLQEDKNVVLAAVAQNVYALKYAAPAYRGAVVAAVVLGAAAAGLFFFRRRTSR